MFDQKRMHVLFFDRFSIRNNGSREAINEKNKYIPPDHLERILNHVPRADKEIIWLLLETGFRVDDILHVRRWQTNGDELVIWERKTAHIRATPVSRKLLFTGNKLAYAFPSRRGRKGDKRHVHRSTIFRHWQQAVKDAGLDGHGYTLHSLRKVYAVQLYKRCGDVQKVQKDLGHKHLSTTLIYLMGALSAS